MTSDTMYSFRDEGAKIAWDSCKAVSPSNPRAVAEEIPTLIEALRIIAGQKQCVDNLMSNQDIALSALSRLGIEEKR